MDFKVGDAAIDPVLLVYDLHHSNGEFGVAAYAAPVHVQAVSGMITAQVRKARGMNNILSCDGEKARGVTVAVH